MMQVIAQLDTQKKAKLWRRQVFTTLDASVVGYTRQKLPISFKDSVTHASRQDVIDQIFNALLREPSKLSRIGNIRLSQFVESLLSPHVRK
jgi:hypothetical protein